MRNSLLCLGVGVCLVLLLSVHSQAADPMVTKDVDSLTRDASQKKWDDLVTAAKPFAKHDSHAVMDLMAPRDPKNPKKSGIGIGPKPGAISPDGIEAKIINMTRNGIAPAELAAHSEHFKKMIDQLAVIAAITHNQAPAKKKQNDADGAVWKKSSAEMFEKSVALSRALDGKNNAAIKTAAKELDGTCKSCHTIYK